MPPTPTTRARRSTRGGCATRSASPSTPTAGPTASSSTTSARAPARRSTSAASAPNYGWPIREGFCPLGGSPPCAAAPRRVHRSADRLPAPLGCTFITGRCVHAQRPVAGGVRRRLPVRRRRLRQDLAAPRRTDRSTTPPRSPRRAARSPTWRSSPTSRPVAVLLDDQRSGPQDQPADTVRLRRVPSRSLRFLRAPGCSTPVCRRRATSAYAAIPHATCR